MKYYERLFILKDGSTMKAFFSDLEIKEMKRKYPEVDWNN